MTAEEVVVQVAVPISAVAVIAVIVIALVIHKSILSTARFWFV